MLVWSGEAEGYGLVITGRKLVTTGAALVVQQYVYIDTFADLCAGNAAGGTAEYSAEQRAGQSAEGDTNRPSERANGTSNACAGKRTGGARNCATDTADYRAGVFGNVATDDFIRLTRWT